MRTPVTIAFALLAGVHCAAPAYSGTDDATDEPLVGESARGQGGEATPVSGPSTGSSGGRDDGDPRWAIEAEGLPPMLFTTTARGDDGALYAAGTFAGWLTLGGDTLKSKGADDVVLARVDANGQITWVKSIGSPRTERAPKVTFAEGKVRILAETDGEVDCGSGEMGQWSSGMFFYCLYGPDGAALGGGTFPTGAP